jgi:hypothetical protein
MLVTWQKIFVNGRYKFLFFSEQRERQNSEFIQFSCHFTRIIMRSLIKKTFQNLWMSHTRFNCVAHNGIPDNVFSDIWKRKPFVVKELMLTLLAICLSSWPREDYKVSIIDPITEATGCQRWNQGGSLACLYCPQVVFVFGHHSMCTSLYVYSIWIHHYTCVFSPMCNCASRYVSLDLSVHVSASLLRLKLWFLVYGVQRTICGHSWTTASLCACVYLSVFAQTLPQTINLTQCVHAYIQYTLQQWERKDER